MSTADRNIALYPWFRGAQNLLFWQAVWFLFFQDTLSAADAVLLYVIFDLSTTALEVPLGVLSDRIGRRFTLVLSGLTGAAGLALIGVGEVFWVFALGQVLQGASKSFSSGTDSAFLYESLRDAGREAEVEHQELRAWRFAFAALAVSALSGGALGLVDPRLAFWVTAAAFAVSLGLGVMFAEPKADIRRAGRQSDVLRAAFRQPALRWLFVLSLLMYVFSHLPFVFGQPFILEALESVGLAGEAPLVSGAVAALMMVLSLAASVVAPRLRSRLGLVALLLVAFGGQIGLIAVLAATNSVLAIALLLLRKVPDSLSQPFLLARVQPLLGSAARATYLSLQSFVGRLLLAGTLWLSTLGAPEGGVLDYAQMQPILAAYVLGGVALLLGLWVTRRWAE